MTFVDQLTIICCIDEFDKLTIEETFSERNSQMGQERIQLTDSIKEIVTKMCDGNPGALTALCEIIKDKEIDPPSFCGSIGAILLFDTLGIHGTEIYVLWNDQCHRDTRQLVMLMRACQLGFISNEKIVAMAKDQMRQHIMSEEELNELDDQVCNALPQFRRRKIKVEGTKENA